MFTLTILLILAVMVALFGCLMGLFSIIGLFFSLLCRRVSVRDVPHLRHRQLQLLRHLGRGRLCLHLDRQQAVPLSRLS